VKRILKLTAVVGLFTSLLTFSAKAAPTTGQEREDNPIGIFFCNRDVEECESTGLHGESQDGCDISVIKIAKNAGWRHKIFRHCFVLLGRKFAETTETSGNEQSLEVISTFGYYPDGEGHGSLRDENFWLLDRDEIKKRVVSCKSVIESNHSGGISRNDILLIWNDLLAETADDVRRDPSYTKTWRHCCNVTWTGLRKTRNNLKNKSIVGLDLTNKDVDLDLKNIDKRGYNGVGRGITFDRSDDSVSNIAKGIKKNIVGGLFAIVKIFINETEGDDDYIFKDL
jgi:hypothetical protein